MRLGEQEFKALRDQAITAAVRAGRVIQSKAGTRLSVERKEAGDTRASQVVTAVDRLSQEAILDTLSDSLETFGLGLLSEELDADRSRFERDYFWCIDPLDGTLPFSEKRSGYAVSIALVSRSGVAHVGVVLDPDSGVLYDALRGGGARRGGVRWLPRYNHRDGVALKLFCDRSLLADPRFAGFESLLLQEAERRGYSGVSVTCHAGAVMNACWVLENGPACYLKFPKPGQGGGSLWDFAATACLFGELGFAFGDAMGAPLALNRSESTFLNHRGFCCATVDWFGECLRTFLTRG